MIKIKKTIGLDKESCDLLKKKQNEERKVSGDGTDRLLSITFERALIQFYNIIDERLEPPCNEVVKRQTVYISLDSNSKYNELAFRYGYNLQELANLIIKTIYG